MFNFIKTYMLIEDLVLTSFNFSELNCFSNKKILYFYPNYTRMITEVSYGNKWKSMGDNHAILNFDL
jgi:hypothetical protein